MLQKLRFYYTAALLLAPAALYGATSSASGYACYGAVAAGGNCDGGSGLTSAFKTIANTIIFIVGAVSVLMIIIGGLRYVLSGGDSAGVKGAKDTILYAIVGVVVAILAYAMVAFILSRF